MGISCGNQRHKKIILVMIIPLIQAGDNVLRDAERHILRLRGELVAVKAAREAVMAEADNLFFRSYSRSNHLMATALEGTCL